MNVTPPEAETEYSTGSGASKPVLRRRLQGNRDVEDGPRAGSGVASSRDSGRLAAGCAAARRRGVHDPVHGPRRDELGADQDRRDRAASFLRDAPDRDRGRGAGDRRVARHQPAGAAGDRAARSSRAADRAAGRPSRRARLGPGGLEHDALCRRELDAERRPVPGNARRGRARDHLRGRLHRARLAGARRRSSSPERPDSAPAALAGASPRDPAASAPENNAFSADRTK